jgi:hypothetical protein
MDMRYLECERGRRIPYIVENSKSSPKAVALLVHGIFSEKNEDGRFTRLSQVLARMGIMSVRFDYCGHGDHSYQSWRFSISNALVDLVQIAKYVRSQHISYPFYIIASSFGGSLTLLYLRLTEAVLPDRLVLLNPVTDFQATFLSPMGRQMQERFNSHRLKKVREEGEADFGDGFILTLPLILELELYRPYETFPDLKVPTLVIHGDNDTAVPYSVSREQALQSPAVRFKTIHGADHAFVEPHHEAQSFEMIGDFLG